MLKDYPELEKTFLQLQKQKDAIKAKSDPLIEERDALRAKIQPVEDEIYALNKKIKAIEQPHLAELDRQLSAIARGTGGRQMSDGGGEAQVIEAVDVGSVEEVLG